MLSSGPIIYKHNKVFVFTVCRTIILFHQSDRCTRYFIGLSRLLKNVTG